MKGIILTLSLIFSFGATASGVEMQDEVGRNISDCQIDIQDLNQSSKSIKECIEDAQKNDEKSRFQSSIEELTDVLLVDGKPFLDLIKKAGYYGIIITALLYIFNLARDKKSNQKEAGLFILKGMMFIFMSAVVLKSDPRHFFLYLTELNIKTTVMQLTQTNTILNESKESKFWKLKNANGLVKAEPLEIVKNISESTICINNFKQDLYSNYSFEEKYAFQTDKTLNCIEDQKLNFTGISSLNMSKEGYSTSQCAKEHGIELNCGEVVDLNGYTEMTAFIKDNYQNIENKTNNLIKAVCNERVVLRDETIAQGFCREFDFEDGFSLMTSDMTVEQAIEEYKAMQSEFTTGFNKVLASNIKSSTYESDIKLLNLPDQMLGLLKQNTEEDDGSFISDNRDEKIINERDLILSNTIITKPIYSSITSADIASNKETRSEVSDINGLNTEVLSLLESEKNSLSNFAIPDSLKRIATDPKSVVGYYMNDIDQKDFKTNPLLFRQLKEHANAGLIAGATLEVGGSALRKMGSRSGNASLATLGGKIKKAGYVLLFASLSMYMVFIYAGVVVFSLIGNILRSFIIIPTQTVFLLLFKSKVERLINVFLSFITVGTTPVFGFIFGIIWSIFITSLVVDVSLGTQFTLEGESSEIIDVILNLSTGAFIAAFLIFMSVFNLFKHSSFAKEKAQEALSKYNEGDYFRDNSGDVEKRTDNIGRKILR